MNSTATQIANLTTEKRALLSKLLNSKRQFQAETIPKLLRTNNLPLSFAQERMWFLAQLEPDNPRYNVSGAIQISGLLNILRLEQCVNHVVRRHEALHTIFKIQNGVIEQVIANHVDVVLTQFDLSGFSKAARENEQEEIIERELWKPFNLLAGDPLLRVTVLTLGAQQYTMLLSMHHIISDEWSLRLLISEIGQFYSALNGEQPANLSELEIQYADYASWQRHKLTGKEKERLLDYWLNSLADAPQLLELPYDRIRPSQPTYRGDIYSINLSQTLTDGIVHFSKTSKMTLFMTLIGAFSILLHRYAATNDLCIGYPATNRNKLELEKLIGFFVNTLVMRSKLDNDICVTEYFAQVKRNLLDAQKYQELPFEQLVETLKPERDLSYHPIFQVMFSYQDRPFDFPKISDLNFKLIEPKSITAKFDLTLQITQTENGLTCLFEYSTDLFTASTIATLASHFENLLTSIIKHPSGKISELSMLNHDERRKILYNWNATQVDYPKHRCIHQLFETQAEQTPNAIALQFQNQNLTYAELNIKANQLAHYLIAQGVRSDMLVDICVERSLEMVIGLLGILKAGGAYVPLDPNYPSERLQFMLNDISPPVVLTQIKLLTQHYFGMTKVLSLDSDWSKIEIYPVNNPNISLHPESLAYCIYTSGSTGQPKGAGVSHQGILNRLQWMQMEYRLDSSDSVLQKTPYSFDVSVWEFFWPLMIGSHLMIADAELHKDSLELIALIRRENITTIHFVPSMLHAFIETPGVENCTSLRRVICSGEALSVDLVMRFQQKLSAELHNLYGPTEASIDVSYWACSLNGNETAIPIGRPISNIRLYILDCNLNPVPVGTPGELHIAGVGLGRGYLKRPEMTAIKFIPNPFNSDGSRMYKTGDLARYRQDGTIDYLGRIDHQVKIRGFRIELGEIEAQLLAHPDVKEAVVLVREDQPGDKRLVAYVVENQSGILRPDMSKTQLKDVLPDYMIPNAFVILASMPLNANGKLDRKKLPAPDITEQLSKQYVAARTKTEAILVKIWQEVLGIENVGVEDDFFELGGHSLLATQLYFFTQKQFTTKVTFKAFLSALTIAAQARLIDGEQIAEAMLDLDTEAILDGSILPQTLERVDVAAAQYILLTGATGFLGVFILADLLELTQAQVYCLVRAKSEQQAMERLQQQIEQYKLSNRINFSRIIPVCGDLAEPKLGLTEKRYQEIVTHVEVIYHNGALVNFVQSYHTLKAANVLGTEEVLRLASYGKNKAIHYVSTVSVFSETPAQSTGHKEIDEPKQWRNLPNGYAQSKWVAEKLVIDAKERGFQVSIYRPAIVAGDSRTGAWNTSDFWCRLIKGCIQMGYAPNESVRLDMAPVDYMSRSIVALSLQNNSVGSIFHLNHPEPPYSNRWLDCFENLGYHFKRIPYREWLEHALEMGRNNPDEFALTSLLPSFSEQLRDENTLMVGEERFQYDCRATHEVLSGLGVKCAPIERENIARYQTYFVENGFIPAPVDKYSFSSKKLSLQPEVGFNCSRLPDENG